MVFQAAKRIAQLDAAHEGLVFGRLDLLPTLDPEPRYIGRIGLRDDDRDSLLIDWRAPAAAVFYQATAAEPQDVVRRRVLRCAGPKVVGVEDELLDAEAETDLPIVGEGALMAQLSRARDRSMHSIVATIQAEQDKAIRAPSRGVVSISGGPGTGKTVVALHRAAFLLYSDRRRYETGGVLVVGPSGVFMRYIERVLPSLGETAVALRSLGEVVGGLRAIRHDAPDGRGRQGLGPDGRADAAYVAPAGAGLPQGVPGVLARRRDPARPRSAREAAPTADEPGPAQPPAPADRVVAARRDVAAGARRARSRPWSRGVRRRHALLRRVRGVRAVMVARARRHRGARVAARPGVPGPGRRGPRDRRRAATAHRLLAGRLVVGGGRPAGRRAALRPRRRARPTRRGPRARRLPGRRPGERPRGAEHGLGARVRARRPGLDAAHPLHRRRRLCPRPGRRGTGPQPDAVADGRPPWTWRDLDDRGRRRPVVLARPGRVRRRPGGRDRGQGPPRVPPLDQLPQLLRDLRVRRVVRLTRRARRRPPDRGALDRGVAA